MLRRLDQMQLKSIESCHGGRGTIRCRAVLSEGDSERGIQFMHDDLIEPGDSVGEHTHTDSEEIYFVVEGEGRIILDGKEYPVKAGDVSLVKSGHSHGLKNSPHKPMRLIVVGIK